MKAVRAVVILTHGKTGNSGRVRCGAVERRSRRKQRRKGPEIAALAWKLLSRVTRACTSAAAADRGANRSAMFSRHSATAVSWASLVVFFCLSCLWTTLSWSTYLPKEKQATF